MARCAVILTGSLGSGHDASAGRLGEPLGALGWSVRTVDTMSLLGRPGGAAGEAVFRQLISLGGVYDALHYAHLRTGSRLALAIDRVAVARVLPALRRNLHPEETLLVATFPTGASAATRIARERPGNRTVVICTDSVVHRLWVHPGTDLFIVTSPAAAASLRRYQPRAKVAVVRMPLDEQFRRPPTREEARTALGLPQDTGCVLLLGGGWGIGPIYELSVELGRRGLHVLAVAGRNRRLYRRLTALAERSPTVHPFPFTGQMATMMAAADVVATAPGAASCGETRAVGRPLVLLDVLPGHGREAIDHELERGAAAVGGPDPAKAAAVVLAVLDELPFAGSGYVTDGDADWSADLKRALATVTDG